MKHDNIFCGKRYQTQLKSKAINCKLLFQVNKMMKIIVYNIKKNAEAVCVNTLMRRTADNNKRITFTDPTH